MKTKITEIRNVTIPDFFNMSIAENMDVGIVDGQIDWVRPSNNSTKKGCAIEPGIIDGTGKVLTPGMVNLHAHTAMTLLRGTAEDCSAIDWFNKYIWIYEQGLTSEDVYLGSLLGGAEMLLNGITAVADHYFFMEQSFKAFDQLGMRADLSWALFGAGDKVEENFEKAMNFISEYRNKTSRINVSLGPHSPYLCPDEFLKKIVDISREKKLKIHLHASEDERQNILSIGERGKTPIQVLNDIGLLPSKKETDRQAVIIAHAYYATETDMDIMAEANCFAVHCPKTYLRFGDAHNFLQPALDRCVNIALGTDGAASNSTMNIFEQARLAALMAKGASENAESARLSQILPLMFAGGRALGFPNYGKILPGNPADLLLLKLDTPSMLPGMNLFADILYGLEGRNIDSVIVDGDLLVSKGQLLSLDYLSLKEEALSTVKRLSSIKANSPMQKY